MRCRFGSKKYTAFPKPSSCGAMPNGGAVDRGLRAGSHRSLGAAPTARAPRRGFVQSGRATRWRREAALTMNPSRWALRRSTPPRPCTSDVARAHKGPLPDGTPALDPAEDRVELHVAHRILKARSTTDETFPDLRVSVPLPLAKDSPANDRGPERRKVIIDGPNR
jgi:hypothetical protein